MFGWSIREPGRFATARDKGLWSQGAPRDRPSPSRNSRGSSSGAVSSTKSATPPSMTATPSVSTAGQLGQWSRGLATSPTRHRPRHHDGVVDLHRSDLLADVEGRGVVERRTQHCLQSRHRDD
eukprot:324839-Pyramimonas_sp.AAC.2